MGARSLEFNSVFVTFAKHAITMTMNGPVISDVLLRRLSTTVSKKKAAKRVVHLQNLIFVDRSIDSLPFISLGKRPLFVAVPPPVQLGDTLLHALYESVYRAHTILRVLGTTLEGRQRDDTVIYDDPNLFGRGEGGVGTRQHCSGEGTGTIVNNYWTCSPHETYTGIGYWSRREQVARSGRASSWECGRKAKDRTWRVKSS